MREEVIAQLRNAGLFQRQVIGATPPEERSDEELNEFVAELGRITVVSEATGKPLAEISESDITNFIREARDQAVEQALGVKPSELTDLGRAMVESKLRDQTGTSSASLDQLVDEAFTGARGTGLIRDHRHPDTSCHRTSTAG